MNQQEIDIRQLLPTGAQLQNGKYRVERYLSSGNFGNILCYTPGYAPIEQVNQNMEAIGPWTDIYALGATLYNLLTAVNPSTVSGGMLLFSNVVSPKMKDLIKWMMNADISARPQSIADVKKYLRAKNNSTAMRPMPTQRPVSAQKPVPPIKKKNGPLPIGTCLKGGEYRIDVLVDTTDYFNIYQAMKRNGNVILTIAEYEDHTPDFCEKYPLVREKYKKELTILRNCRIRHIAVPYDVFDENGTTYFVTNLLDGIPLSKYIQQRRPLDELQALSVFNDLLEAMGAAHKSCIYHNYLTPKNILIDKTRYVEIVNFDILHKFVVSAAVANRPSEPWEDDAVFATPSDFNYLAPEIMFGKIVDSPSADIYSLGATLSFMLSGEEPTMGNKPKLPTTVSMKTQKLVHWMMEMKPENRPESIEEVRSFLEESDSKKSPSMFSLVILAFIILIIVGAVLLFSGCGDNQKITDLFMMSAPLPVVLLPHREKG